MHQEDIMNFISVVTFAFMLIVTMVAAYPARKEKMMNKDHVRAIMNTWNEFMGKDNSAEDINLWNRKAEKGHNKVVEWNGRDMDRGGKLSEKEETDGEIEAGCEGRICFRDADCCPANPDCTPQGGFWEFRCN